jgi:ribosome-associated heat shock protein Hsp15
MPEPLRVDVLLDRLCITRSRNEAKTACDAGAVRVDGAQVKPSHLVSGGQTIEVRFPTRTLEIALDALPPKSISKKAARDLFRVLRDEPRISL